MADTVTIAPQEAGRTDTAPDAFKPDLCKYKRWFNNYETNKTDEIEEQLTARRYYNGRQWTDEQIAKLKKRGQAPVFDNRIGRKIDFLVGVEQRQRRDPKGYPRTPKDEKTADTATAAMRYICDAERWQFTASSGTEDGLIDGIGVICVGMKDKTDGRDPTIVPVQRDRFFYDPRSMRPDFMDACFMGLHIWMDVDDAKEKWPHMRDQFDSLIDRASTTGVLMRAENNHVVAWADFDNRRIRVVEFWEKTAQGWMFCNFTGDTEIECGPSPYMDEDGKPDCPYVAWSPYVDEKGDRYGPIRNMKPMQDEVKHRRSKFLHRLNQKTVYIRRGSVEDIDEFRREANKVDGVIEHDGEWGKDTGIVDNSQDLKGQAELLAQSQSSLENLGPNPGLIGKGGGVADQSGRAILAQRDSGMTELSPVFERNRAWKLRVYRKVWARIKQCWTAERWIRITDDDNAPQFIGLNQIQQDPMTGQVMSQNYIPMIDVDIIMEEGPDTITMNEELLQSLSQLGPGAVPPSVFIELSNAPNKERLFKLIEKASAPNPEIAEMQKRMGQLEELLAAAKVDSETAKTENMRADTVTKLKTAFTPEAQQTNEFGMPMGPPPQAPDFATALSLMQAFPLEYGQPTLEQLHMRAQSTMPPPQGEDTGGEEPGEDPNEEQGQMMPMGGMGGGNSLSGPMPPGMPPEMPGGLPIDPAYAGM